MENRLRKPLNPFGVDLMDYIWLGNSDLKPLLFLVGVRNKSEDMLPAKYLRQAQKPHHPIRIASLEKSESVFFMKQRSQTPIWATSGRQA